MPASLTLCGALALTVTATIAYHIAQKSIPVDVHPLASLIVTYSVALAGSVVIYAIARDETTKGPEHAPLSSYSLGVAIIGLELGYLLMYRAGWPLNLASAVCNAAVALALAAIGAIVFLERMTTVRAVGLTLMIAGILVIALGSRDGAA